MARVIRKYIEGMELDGKIIKEVFRNMAKTEYLIKFTDNSYKIIKHK